MKKKLSITSQTTKQWVGLALSAIAVTGFSQACKPDANNTNHHDKGGDEKQSGQVVYKDVHECAGLNSCRGMGGCAVTAEKLERLAKKRGIELKEAGQAHSCAGLNACKGLGGCAVTAEQAVELRGKLQKK